MRFKKTIIAGIGTALLTASFGSIAQAYPEDECSIWICLPVGFSVQGCSAGKKIFMKKLRKGKNPIPSWSKCGVSPTYSQETIDNAEKLGIQLNTEFPKQPYDSNFGKRVYFKGEDQILREAKSGANIMACTRKGYMTTEIVYVKETPSHYLTIKELWKTADCNVSWVVATTTRNPQFTDLNTIYRDHISGMQYQELVDTRFEKKLLKTTTRKSSKK